MGDDRGEIVRFWIEEMVKKKGINKYTMNVLGSSSKGDGYTGDINFATVDCVLENDQKKLYDIVIKSKKIIDADQIDLPIEESFEREVKMYTEVFPAVESLQKEYATEKSFLGYPECYSVCTTKKREAILLQNLKNLRYLLHDRQVPQNFDHIMLVFKNYALWHGATLALKLKKPELFKTITKDMTDVLGNSFKKQNWQIVFKKFLQKSINILKKGGNTLAAKKFEDADIDASVIVKLTLNDDDEAQKEAVITHGDCWNNNMMFKYEGNDTSKLIDVKFLDFQLSTVASPILDLSYFLYTAADKSTLDKFDDLLEEYHKTMSSYLRQFNINCDDILSLERLKKTWKKFGIFGLLLCPFVTRGELSQEGEFIDFSKTSSEHYWDGLINNDIKYQEEYDRRVYNVYSHFAEKFL